MSTGTLLQSLAITKTEYTDLLVRVLQPQIIEGFQSIYDTAMEVSKKDGTPEQVLSIFQRALSLIPTWNKERIDMEYNRIKEDSGCTFLDDLITIVFVCFAKTYALVKRMNGPTHSKFDLPIPEGPIFLHLCYIEAARSIWCEPYLFYDKVSAIQYHQHRLKLQTHVKDGILLTIRNNIPVETIMTDYIGNPSKLDRSSRSQSFSSDSDEPETHIPISPIHTPITSSAPKRRRRDSNTSLYVEQLDIDALLGGPVSPSVILLPSTTLAPPACEQPKDCPEQELQCERVPQAKDIKTEQTDGAELDNVNINRVIIVPPEPKTNLKLEPIKIPIVIPEHEHEHEHEHEQEKGKEKEHEHDANYDITRELAEFNPNHTNEDRMRLFNESLSLDIENPHKKESSPNSPEITGIQQSNDADQIPASPTVHSVTLFDDANSL